MKHLNDCMLRVMLFTLVAAFQPNLQANQKVEQNADSSNQTYTSASSRNNPLQLLFAGKLIQREEKRQVFVIPAFFELFPFNTVEGFTTNLTFGFTQKLKGEHFYQLKPAIRYGFGNQHLNGELFGRYYYHSKRKAILTISGGKFVDQLNKESNLSAFSNTQYTLGNEENFLKIYERRYLELSHSFSPIKDILISGRVLWEDRHPLQNLSKYAKADQEFTSNDPENKELTPTGFHQHTAFEWEVGLSWQYQHNYIRERGELVSNSEYPMISLNYITSSPDVLGSDLSFQRLSLGLTENYFLRSLGRGKLLIEAGNFLSTKDLRFIDFKHFNGQRTVYDGFVIGDFKLLDYYLHSTTSFYIQGHLEHHFKRFLSTRQWQPVLSVNYLSTEETPSYIELGLGVTKLFKQWRVDFFNSWEGYQHDRTGIRFGYVID